MKDFYEDENCGHCSWHRKEDDCWVCTNPDSECYGCYTEYKEVCEDFEERPQNTRFSVELKKSKKF